ncbi:ROK family transcriptional regulator [Neobacillus vireti LMG 21834]|uniref:ROK family transcriptional regulator n=1 Tax=Neobacillus vireti LMG 21834 TaxID=1131730 RepID=A0AB94IMH7_9BACI|nr:ROK family transcriptional regulator [Neobacillus vireti LMG 21834]
MKKVILHGTRTTLLEFGNAAKLKLSHTLASPIVTSKYIPSEHLPGLKISDWKQDYLYGLQRLGLELMLHSTKE